MKKVYGLLLVVLLTVTLPMPMQVFATEVTTTEAAEVQTTEEEAASESEESDKLGKLIADVKEKLENGELETEEDIRKAILEGCDKLGIELSEEKIDKIIAAVNKLDDLKLDPGKAIGEIISSAVGKFFENIGNYMVEFFKGLFM